MTAKLDKVIYFSVEYAVNEIVKGLLIHQQNAMWATIRWQFDGMLRRMLEAGRP